MPSNKPRNRAARKETTDTDEQLFPKLAHTELMKRAEHFKRELLCRVLTARHVPNRAPYLSKVFGPSDGVSKERFKGANLVGVGFGAKESNGRIVGNLAVRVYVTKKVAIGALSRKDRIPEAVNGVPTDVVAVGRLRLHDGPAKIGASISNANGREGTLGCVVEIPGNPDWYLLSAAHVLAPHGQANLGDSIVIPAAGLGGVSIGTLEAIAPMAFDGSPVHVDAGLVKLTNKSGVSLSIARIGPLLPTVVAPKVFQSVRKFGAATQHTLGVVIGIAEDIHFTVAGIDIPYLNTVQVVGCGGPFSEGGDSGALVVDALSSQAVGLLAGGNSTGSFACLLARVLTHFGVTIAQ